ncbi:MAG: hypothetical protein CMI23_09550, partial [Opitutae bacterium]|nr:hypothetical protein [Opitutae bacterium]
MKIISTTFSFLIITLFLQAQNAPQEIVDPKGAIIIAQLEGDVTITNNTTGDALPADRVKSG